MPEISLEQLIAQKDLAYSERNKVIALAAKMAIAIGYPAYLAPHFPEDDDWDDDWRNVVFIELPTGQLSWHYHDSDRSLFSFLPQQRNEWDGHTMEEKYDRVARFISE